MSLSLGQLKIKDDEDNKRGRGRNRGNTKGTGYFISASLPDDPLEHFQVDIPSTDDGDHLNPLERSVCLRRPPMARPHESSTPMQRVQPPPAISGQLSTHPGGSPTFNFSPSPSPSFLFLPARHSPSPAASSTPALPFQDGCRTRRPGSGRRAEFAALKSGRNASPTR